jgi:F-type H+-transporting ATPase subunit epsilon
MQELILSVVTPERAIVKDLTVSSIVLPGETGQMDVLPGHTNLITLLRQGTFGYRTGDNWQVAFLSGGFAQVYGNRVTVLAETLEMAQELDVARAELDLQDAKTKLKSVKVGSPEYTQLESQKLMAEAKLSAAQKKIR